MRSYPGRPFAAVLVGSVLAVAARAQEGAHAAAMAAFERGDFARALQGIDEVLARTPRSLDGLYLRAAALAELGRLDESEAVRARIVEVERDLGRDLDERLARARRARLAEAAGNQPVKPSTAPAGASAASRAAELAELPSWIPEQVAQEGEVKAFERVREFVDDGNLPPAARADAVIALAKSSTPEVAAIGKQAAKELVRQLAKESSESGAGAVGAPGGEGAADSTPGEARSEPSPSGRDGDEGQDDDDERVAAVLRVAAALDELHLPGEAVDLLVGFAALRRPTAKTLRAIAATLEGWAARIDAMERDDPKRPRQVEGYFAAVRRVYGEVHTRGAAVAGIATLSNSADEELAARANEERSVMAKRSVARAEVLKREQKSAAAARELDHAAACEPSRIDAAAEAAQLYEGVGALADAARLYKWILARDGGDFARRSRERLIALWQAAKARAGDIRTAVNTLPQDDEGRARGTLALVEMGMPVLEGPELEFVRDQISDGGFAQATARLNDLIGGVASQVEPAWPARVSLDAAPRVGRDFELRDLSVAGRWVDGADGEPGMWCTLAPVDRELTRLVGKYGFPTFDEPSGYTAVSWFNAQVFCGELTIRERDAERLPPGCEYRLPTIAELDRIRAVTGRVTDRDVAWLWTCETGWPDFNARGRRRPFAWPTAPGREAEEQDSSRPIPKIGFVVVLAPAR